MTPTIKSPDSDAERRYLSLFDAFLNASMMFSLMNRAKLEDSPIRFDGSDRFRLHRFWAACLYVLIESYTSEFMIPAVQYIRERADTKALDQLIAGVKDSDAWRRMYEVRGYMFHRDRREIYDTGRLTFVEDMELHHAIQVEFGLVIKAVAKQDSCVPNENNQD